MTAHALSIIAVVADFAFRGPTPSSLSTGGTIVVVPTDALPPAHKMFVQEAVYGVRAERPGQGAHSVPDIAKTGAPVVVVAALSTDKDAMRGVADALVAADVSVRMVDLSEQAETRDLIAKGQPLYAALASLRGRVPSRELLDRATPWGALRPAPIAARDKTQDQHDAATGDDAPSSSPLPNAPATKTDQQNHARRWMANGFGGHLLTTQPGSKVTHVSRWQKRRQPDAEIISNVENGHGLGLLMGAGFVAFDVEDTEFAPDIRAHLVAHLGPNAPVCSRPGSQSCAFLVRTSTDDSRPIPSAKISARTEDRQCVRTVLEVVAVNNNEKTPRYLHVEGRRDDAGAVMDWTRQPVAAELPVLSRADVDALLAEIADTIRARSPGVELTTSTGDDAGTSTRDDGRNEWAGRAVLDDMTSLLSALSLIENGAWCDYDKWTRGAFAFAALSGGDEEVLSTFQDWSFPPNGDNEDSAPGIFGKGRNGGLSTPPGPAAGIIAGWLRQHPVAGQEDAARALADAIIGAVEERTRTPAHEDFNALEVGGGFPKGKTGRRGVELVRADAITPLAISWLWPNWLAEGKLHLFAGASTTGKTTIALRFAAIVSTGGTLPDGSRAPQGNVVIWSGEDDVQDTIIPRLLAMRADMEHIFIIRGMRDGEKSRAFDPATDMQELGDAIASVGGARLLILDPIVSAVRGDAHRNNDVRRALEPVVALAEKYRAALVGITHFSKGTAGRGVMERINGSVAFGALARIIFAFVKEEAEDGGPPPKRKFIRGDSNIGPDGGGYEYSIEEADVPGHPIRISVANFGHAISGTAREILAEAEADRSTHGKPPREAAKDFLRELLANGPMRKEDVLDAADARGISEATLRRAREALGVRPEKERGVANGASLWRLPTAVDDFTGPDGQ